MTHPGVRFMDLADMYVQQFPIDTSYTPKEFDRWGRTLPEEYRLPYIAKRHGDRGWGTHLQNRHNLKEKINKGGRCNERAIEEMFQISINNDIWRTLPLAAMTIDRTSTLASRMSQTAKTRFKYINSLITNAQFQRLSRGTQIAFENIHSEHERAVRWYNFVMTDLIGVTNSAYAKAAAEIVRLERDGVDVSDIKRFFVGHPALEPPRPIRLRPIRGSGATEE